MDERNGVTPEEPWEVVETFSLQPREVVETYTRPLPEYLLIAEELAEMEDFEEEERPRRKRRIVLYVLLFLLGIVAGAVVSILGQYLLARYWYTPPDFSSYYAEPEDDAPQTVDLPVYQPEEPLEVLLSQDHGASLSAQEIYRRVNPAVVMIQVRVKDGGALGTGVIFTEDGYILTNYHMVEGSTSCKILLADGGVYWASYVAGDPDSDVAVLKIDGEELPAAELGDSEALSVGDKVYAIGNPLNAELRGTFTDGIISAVDRSVSVDGRTMELVQTNAALNSGNSGGPLINEYGQVVGINAIKMVSQYSNIEGLGFAIPTAAIQDIVAELMDAGAVSPGPLLGISVSQIGDPLPDGRAGLLIQDVTPGGAADLAGVKKGDYILAADGTPVTFSTELYQVRRRFRVGDEMPLTLWRNGKIVEVTLVLTEEAPG